MTQEPRTISDHIQCLARLTGAPTTFVDQVKQLFSRKGIALEDDAAPFLPALEEAFRREESIRCSSHRARTEMQQLHKNFRRVGQAYVDQLSQLKKVHSGLKEQARRLRSHQPDTTRVTIRGDHRTFVTRPQREDVPMVPGPTEEQ